MRRLRLPRRTRLERDLVALRSEPRAEFVADVVALVVERPPAERAQEPRFRVGLAATVTAFMGAALLALGAPGYVKAACYGIYNAGSSAWHETAYGFTHGSAGGSQNGSGSDHNGNGGDNGGGNGGGGNGCDNGWGNSGHDNGNNCCDGQNGNWTWGQGNGNGNGNDCHGGSGGGQYGHGWPICHRTGSDSNPWVLIVVDESALPAHAAHGDIIPAPASGCPGPEHGHNHETHGGFEGGGGGYEDGKDGGFTVHVGSDDGSHPGGTVSCFDDNVIFGQASVGSDGSATCSDFFHQSGSHTISWVFTPSDPSHYGSCSGSETVDVAPAASTTTETASTASAPQGAAVTFTATVTGAGPTPTGTVQFYDGTTKLGSAVALDGSGVAATTTGTLSVGSHTISAVYSGDSTYATSQAGVSETITPAVKATTTALLASTGSIAYGGSVTFTATVSGSGGTPSGPVSFSVDGSTVATASLDGNGRAALTLTSLGVGSHTVAVQYGGAPGWAASSSPTVTESVSKAATTTSISAGDTKPSPSENVTFTAHVSTSAGPVTSGSVTFSVDGAAVATVALDGSGNATFARSWPAKGQHKVSAAFAATSGYLASDDTLNLVVQKK